MSGSEASITDKYTARFDSLNGSYEFTSGQLAGFSEGKYYLHIINEIKQNIIEPGIHEDSI